jgi:uroporphyrinogen decarboxylase
MNPGLVASAPPERVYENARAMVAEAEGYPGFILGAAVVPYGTPTEHLLAIRQACSGVSGSASQFR